MSNYAPLLPLTSDPANQFANNHTIEKVALQNLKMLVLTAPGERIMDPNFGVGIRNFLFEQNVASTYSNIKTRIIRQVQEYLSFLEIISVDFDSDTNNPQFLANGLLITIEFVITPLGRASVLSLSV
ncbi:MAG: hypothetical protein GOVbin703_65 [Prokaryotic dsDNA virus sp.]|nr:MAG: hypothetical protein GOVbin703_65 [Prokaryotic dsDNA virus sp.]|tara:strand:- start:2067 stop:2447 length:381 start_codon:yes stop_codon:yes gene_type:complete